MAAPGTYKNPALKSCWETCGACGRCDKKGKRGCPEPNSCSGRYDPEGVIDNHPDDWCDCKNGVLRWKAKKGNIIIVRYKTNPFGGTVRMHQKTEDERDWDAYRRDMAERLGIEDYDPIRITES